MADFCPKKCSTTAQRAARRVPGKHQQTYRRRGKLLAGEYAGRSHRQPREGHVSNQESPSNPATGKFWQPVADNADNSVRPDPIGIEHGFALAVHQALRDYQRPDHLRSNPLLGSRLVSAALAQSPATPPTQALRELLRRHCEALGQNAKTSRFQQVLQHTYLVPLRSQQAAADALHMSWSTYRRCLTDAVRMLGVSLWEAESALRPAQANTNSARRPVRGWYAMTAILLVTVAIAGSVYWQSHRRRRETEATNTAPVTLAVLPFMDLDRQPRGRYLSDGITDELITRLGRSPQLRVVAPTSSFSLRGKPLDVREVGRILGVTHVVEGSVQQAGGMLRIHVALVSTADGYELWSDELKAPRGDIFRTEQAIADAVLQQLQLPVDPAYARHAANDTRVNPEARDAYLVGMEYLNNRTVPDIQTAIGYFKKSIQEDHSYADSWTGLATAYAVWRSYTNTEAADTHYQEALEAAHKAVSLDPLSPNAHAVLGLLHEQHWEWQPASMQLQRALQLDPSDAIARQWYAIYFLHRGEVQNAVNELRLARQADPLSPIINADLGRALSYADQPQQAAAQLRTTVALAPRFGLTYTMMAENDMAMGKYPQALDDIRQAASIWGSPKEPFLLMESSVAEMALGRHDLAARDLAELQQQASWQYLSGALLAWPLWMQGEKNRAFAQLRRAARDHDDFMFLVFGPGWAGLRADPRFARIRTLMNLPAVARRNETPVTRTSQP